MLVWTRSIRSSAILTDAFLRELPRRKNEDELKSLVSEISRELGFSHFALITHEDLRIPRKGQVNICVYPEEISSRIIGMAQFRRDPVMRGCVFADSAFLWSRLDELVALNQRDRAILDIGVKLGLTEGITVPCHKLGHCLGSFTLAGDVPLRSAERMLGIAQMIGVFSFKQARGLSGEPQTIGPRPRLNPRPRDCVVLVGRGHSNKEIARLLDLAPRTVDGYLKDARLAFGAADRTELVISAILAGEIGLMELR